MYMGAEMKHLFHLGIMEEDINPSMLAQKYTMDFSYGQMFP